MDKKGILYGAVAYLAWGLFPVYFKALKSVPSFEIILHRVAWSFLFLVLLITVRREWSSLRRAIWHPKTMLIYTIAALLLAVNWLIYVWSVNAGHVIEASLGYFINPLLNVALGVLLLREKLRPLQWLPVGLAAAGVLYLTLMYGKPPWIALALAFSFGLYGLVKKVASLSALYGLTLETGILFLPSLAILAFYGLQGSGSFGAGGWSISILLALAGVITSLPLLLFASAARRIPLSVLGLLQYFTPTGQFLLGMLLYKEPFTRFQLVGFGLIWLALLIYSIEGLMAQRKSAALPRPVRA